MSIIKASVSNSLSGSFLNYYIQMQKGAQCFSVMSFLSPGWKGNNLRMFWKQLLSRSALSMKVCFPARELRLCLFQKLSSSTPWNR